MISCGGKERRLGSVQTGAPRRPTRAGGRRVNAEATQRSYRTIFGTQKPHQVSLHELLGNDGGAPRFMTPFFPEVQQEGEPSALPIMIYVPGIDGTGLGAHKQLEYLAKGFQLETFMIPLGDKRDFQSLLDIFTEYLEEVVSGHVKDRMVYVMGESFGALLALAAAYRCKDVIDRVILINPATGYQSSFWQNLAPLLPALPKVSYPVVSGMLAPLIVNPLNVLFKNVNGTTSVVEQSRQIVEGGLQMLGTLDFVADYISPEIIKWKLEVVHQGIEHTEPYLHKILQRTLVIAAENDLLLPSTREAERLKKVMLRAFAATLPGKSHAFMEESGVDLLQVLKNEGFYVVERKMSSPVAMSNGTAPSLNNFGRAAPIEIPSNIELRRLDFLIESTQRLSSPVFMSTLEDGSIVEGLDGIPDCRPLLFVGNHTIMALDMNVLVHKLLSDRDILVRGLAHPLVMSEAVNVVKRSDDDELGILGDVLVSMFNPRDAYKLYTLFGAVPVSAKNMHTLLGLGECVLLYPGGAVEALKSRDRKYEITWPERSEFVRMAAKFGATIVTVASVGAEDGIHQLLDAQDMLNNPLIGERLRKFGNEAPQARNGVAAAEAKMHAELVAPPVTIPLKPARQYFLFGKPVTLTPDIKKDNAKSRELYQKFKVELETNISYLIEKREEDPYKEFERRIVYETLNGRQAPSFDPTPFSNGTF